tara:strand:+ start:877 stop:2193 length:1317 start_codon:yes stop_codon:yes gene_type:complete
MSATIFALSTPPGISAVSIIRISGPDTFRAVGRLLGLKKPCKMVFSQLRKVHLRKIFSIEGRLLDEGLVILFEKGRSFTGEDMAELQLHGSHIVIKTVLESLTSLGYARLAKPGEFTKNALENNRLSISEVEGLSDLLVAETEAQQEQALNIYSGSLSKKINSWKERTTRILSSFEAAIDFSDEVNSYSLVNGVIHDLKILETELVEEKEGFKSAESIRGGFEVALVGKPNVGKSTLLNGLAKRKLAITSEITGTTRDIIELRYNLDGLPVTFLDTAGVRHTDDEVEKIGVSNSIDRVNNSDVRVFLTNDKEEIRSFGVKYVKSDIVLRPKGDLPGSEPSISGKTGKGFEVLLETLKKTFSDKVRKASNITRTRHLEKIISCLDHLKTIRVYMEEKNYEDEIIAEELRTILRNFDGLLGVVNTEEILGEIFNSFCIGK